MPGRSIRTEDWGGVGVLACQEPPCPASCQCLPACKRSCWAGCCLSHQDTQSLLWRVSCLHGAQVWAR